MVRSQSFFLSMEMRPIPSGMKAPCLSLMAFRGLWMPSKILPMIPGPNVTARGLPVA